MNQEVASEVQTSSFSNGAHRSVSFKHNNKNVKKNSIYIKKPKNSMDKLLEAFSEDLKKAIKNHELLQGSFMKVDQYMQKVKNFMLTPLTITDLSPYFKAPFPGFSLILNFERVYNQKHSTYWFNQ